MCPTNTATALIMETFPLRVTETRVTSHETRSHSVTESWSHGEKCPRVPRGTPKYPGYPEVPQSTPKIPQKYPRVPRSAPGSSLAPASPPSWGSSSHRTWSPPSPSRWRWRWPSASPSAGRQWWWLTGTCSGEPSLIWSEKLKKWKLEFWQNHDFLTSNFDFRPLSQPNDW